MLDLRAYVRPGDGVWWSPAGAEAIPLVDALLQRLLPADVGLVQVSPPPRSTAHGRSAIVPALRGPVSTARRTSTWS